MIRGVFPGLIGMSMRRTCLVTTALWLSCAAAPASAGSVFFRQIEAVDFCQARAAAPASDASEKLFCDGVRSVDRELDATPGRAMIAKAADAGYLYAELYVGEDYFYSTIPGDQDKALYWLGKASDQGSVEAEVLLSHQYSTGTPTVRADYAKALYWLRKAADAGFGNARIGLAYDYGHGILVPRDEAEAVRWYDLAAACDRDDETLAAMTFLFGDGSIPKNEAHGLALLTDAADAGYAPAQVDLAEVYFTGMGAPRDLVKSDMWYEVALKTDQGLPGTVPVESAMTSAQIAEAHALANAKATQIAETKKDIPASR